jgi:hypothetical protein
MIKSNLSNGKIKILSIALILKIIKLLLLCVRIIDCTYLLRILKNLIACQVGKASIAWPFNIFSNMAFY